MGNCHPVIFFPIKGKVVFFWKIIVSCARNPLVTFFSISGSAAILNFKMAANYYMYHFLFRYISNTTCRIKTKVVEIIKYKVVVCLLTSQVRRLMVKVKLQGQRSKCGHFFYFKHDIDRVFFFICFKRIKWIVLGFYCSKFYFFILETLVHKPSLI